MFCTKAIEDQLLKNYQKQTLNFTNCINSYQKLLHEWNDMRLQNIRLKSEKDSLELNINENQVIEMLTQEKQTLEQKIKDLLEELDILKQNVDTLNINFNDSFEKCNEEKEKNENLSKKLAESEKNNKLLFETTKQNQEQINYLASQLESSKLDQEKMCETIKSLSQENIYLVDQLKKSKDCFVEKMNEINEMEEEVKKRKKEYEKEIQIFKNREKEFSDQQDKFKQIVLNKPRSKENNNNFALDLGIIPSLEANFQGTKNEYPKSIAKKMVKYHNSEIYAIACNLNGSVIASCSGDHTIKFYDPIRMESKGLISNENKIYTCLSFSNFHDYLLYGDSEKNVDLYNCSIGKLKFSMTGHSAKINSVNFLNDKTRCISSSDDRSVKIWDLDKAFCLSSINTGSSCQTLDYFSYEPTVATGHKDGSLRLYSIKDGKLIDQKKNLFDAGLSCVKLSSNNYYVLCSSVDGTALKLYDLRMRKLLFSLTDDDYFNSSETQKVSFGPDDKYVFAGTTAGNVIIWSIEDGMKKDVLKSEGQGVTIVSEYNVIAGQLFAGDSRGTLTIWH